MRKTSQSGDNLVHSAAYAVLYQVLFLIVYGATEAWRLFKDARLSILKHTLLYFLHQSKSWYAD